MPDPGPAAPAPIVLPWREALWPHPIPGDLGLLLGRSLDGHASPVVVMVESSQAAGADLDAAGSITLRQGAVALSFAAFFPPLEQLVALVLAHTGPSIALAAQGRVASLLEEHISHRFTSQAGSGAAAPRHQRVSAVLDDTWTGSSLDEASRWVITRAALLTRRHQAETDLATMKIREALRTTA